MVIMGTWLWAAWGGLALATPPEALRPVALGESVGFIDTRGQVVISGRFEDARRFYEGLAAARQGDRWGFIGPKGDFVVPPAFLEVMDFAEGLAAVRTEGGWGYLDTLGDPVTEAEFIYATPFSDGRATVGVKRRLLNLDFIRGDDWGSVPLVGIIDATGAYVHPPRVGGAAAVSSDRWMAGQEPPGVPELLALSDGPGHPSDRARDAGVSLMDAEGARLAGPWEHLQPFSEGLAVACTREEQHRACGFVDLDGIWVIPPFTSTFPGPFHDGRALVRVPAQDGGALYGFIDRTGEWVIEPRFAGAGPFSEGRAQARLPNSPHYGYIDASGEWVIEPRFYRAFPFEGGTADVLIHPASQGLIDVEGNLVWQGRVHAPRYISPHRRALVEGEPQILSVHRVPVPVEGERRSVIVALEVTWKVEDPTELRDASETALSERLRHHLQDLVSPSDLPGLQSVAARRQLLREASESLRHNPALAGLQLVSIDLREAR